MDDFNRNIDRQILKTNTIARAFTVLSCILGAVAGIMRIIKNVREIKKIDAGEVYKLDD